MSSSKVEGIIIIVIINEKINVAFSQKKLQGHVTHAENDDVFGRQRKKQEGQRHQYEVANKYVFKCRLKVDSDEDDVTKTVNCSCSDKSGRVRSVKSDTCLILRYIAARLKVDFRLMKIFVTATMA